VIKDLLTEKNITKPFVIVSNYNKVFKAIYKVTFNNSV